LRVACAAKGRRGISVITATVLIVAATLVAFAAVAGYVFGILGTGSNTANVTVTSVSLSAHGVATNGTITFANSGTATTQVPKDAVLSLSYGGTSCAYSNTNGASVAITGGGGTANLAVKGVASGAFCTGTNAAAGESFTGSVALANGEPATFTGTFSA